MNNMSECSHPWSSTMIILLLLMLLVLSRSLNMTQGSRPWVLTIHFLLWEKTLIRISQRHLRILVYLLFLASFCSWESSSEIQPMQHCCHQSQGEGHAWGQRPLPPVSCCPPGCHRPAEFWLACHRQQWQRSPLAAWAGHHAWPSSWPPSVW